MKKISLLIIGIFCMFLLACSSEEKIEVMSFEMNVGDTISLNAGISGEKDNKVRCYVQIKDGDKWTRGYDYLDVTGPSSDKNGEIAQADEYFVFEAKKPGELKVTFELVSDKSIKKIIYFTVLNEYTLEGIEDYQIFDMPEDEYYIFFAKADCPYCKKARPKVSKYMQMITSYPDKYSKNLKVYEVYTVSETKESIIHRAYKGEGGQGNENKYYVDGVTKWDELYIPTAPSLIKISIKNGVKTSEYIAQGYTKVTTYLEGTL